jgi:SsrA-binding protein
MSIINKKAKFEYILGEERLEAGLSLTGGEAKAIREGRADLSRAVVRILNTEAFLINANIPVPGAVKYDSTRSRKLLLHRQEITQILTRSKQQKLTLVPLKLYTKGHLVKLALALGKPKHQYQKKATIRERDIERDLERELS